MIEYIVGKFKEIKNGYLILENNGIGYSIFVPTGSISARENEEIKVFVYLVHKEDNMSLYGFGTELEKDIFVSLISVTGVGPKSAISILSKESTENIVTSIANGEEKVLSAVSGVGQKTAKKIILELKEKFRTYASTLGIEGGIKKDVKQEKRIIEALVSLGYKKGEAKEIVRAVKIENAMSDDEYLKYVLKEISKSK